MARSALLAAEDSFLRDLSETLEQPQELTPRANVAAFRSVCRACFFDLPSATDACSSTDTTAGKSLPALVPGKLTGARTLHNWRTKNQGPCAVDFTHAESCWLQAQRLQLYIVKTKGNKSQAPRHQYRGQEVIPPPYCSKGIVGVKRVWLPLQHLVCLVPEAGYWT